MDLNINKDIKIESANGTPTTNIEKGEAQFKEIIAKGRRKRSIQKTLEILPYSLGGPSPIRTPAPILPMPSKAYHIFPEREECKRLNHLKSEHRRRAEIQIGIRQLHSELPSECKSKKLSKLEIIKQATEYIHHLEQALAQPCHPSSMSVASSESHAQAMATASAMEMVPILLPLDSFSDANAQCI